MKIQYVTIDKRIVTNGLLLSEKTKRDPLFNIKVRSIHQHMMDMKLTMEYAFGNCAVFAEVLQRIFPEDLRVVEGNFFDVGLRMNFDHFWCETKNNDLLDPTWIQFESGGIYIMPNEELPDCFSRNYFFEETMRVEII